jgi:hypothetical protein
MNTLQKRIRRLQPDDAPVWLNLNGELPPPPGSSGTVYVIHTGVPSKSLTTNINDEGAV